MSSHRAWVNFSPSFYLYSIFKFFIKCMLWIRSNPLKAAELNFFLLQIKYYTHTHTYLFFHQKYFNMQVFNKMWLNQILPKYILCTIAPSDPSNIHTMVGLEQGRHLYVSFPMSHLEGIKKWYLIQEALTENCHYKWQAETALLRDRTKKFYKKVACSVSNFSRCEEYS